MTSLIQRLLTAEAALFGGAALMHAGFLIPGHAHWKAATAESVIAVVLLGGLVATLAAPASGRAIGLGAQGFALLGTLVGVFTIAVGVGPRTALDLVIHACMIALLAFGIRAPGARSRHSCLQRKPSPRLRLKRATAGKPKLEHRDPSPEPRMVS